MPCWACRRPGDEGGSSGGGGGLALELARLSFPDLGMATVEGHKDGEALGLGRGTPASASAPPRPRQTTLTGCSTPRGATAFMLLEVGTHCSIQASPPLPRRSQA